MNLKSKLFLVAFLMGITFGFAQEENSEVSETNILNEKHKNLNLLTSGVFVPKQNAANTAYQQRNNILINQVGVNNQVVANVNSSNAEFDLSQTGNENNIQLEVNADSYRANVQQNGNNNYVIDNIYQTNRAVELNVQQNGNNLSIERYGVNSKTSDMQISQQQNSPSVIIRSFE